MKTLSKSIGKALKQITTIVMAPLAVILVLGVFLFIFTLFLLRFLTTPIYYVWRLIEPQRLFNRNLWGLTRKEREAIYEKKTREYFDKLQNVSDARAPWLVPIIEREISKYRKLTYKELEQKLGDIEGRMHGLYGSKGFYQTEIQFIYDDLEEGPIRVMASIDDGSKLAYRPMGRSFIKTPDNTYIDEEE
ncbi:hypothetical protein HY380_00250 [Candidatus Saccharibacteria bacterium]|nr:hypothetical protein [Candidatus Saccharibacteria bacterium]